MRRFALSLALVAATASPAPAQPAPLPPGEPVVVAQSYTLESEVLGERRRINVYLPPGAGATGERYPVLYLLDGGVEEDLFHVVGLATLAADFRRIRPFAVVGIEGIDRYHDLTPPTSVPEERERLPTSGGSAEFRAFLARELIPFVEARFPVSGETVLMGESIAGLFVVETLLLEPRLFQGYVAVSPSLQWDAGSLVDAAAARLRDPGFPADRRLELSMADEDGGLRTGVERLVAALESGAPAGLDWHYAPLPEEDHGTVFHPAAWAALRRLFATGDAR